MREYTDKVAASMGDAGTDGTKSPVAKPNNMGGTSANIAKGSADETGSKAAAPKTDDHGNVNKPGGKASKSMTAAKKPAMAGSDDKAAGSMLNGAPKRAK